MGVNMLRSLTIARESTEGKIRYQCLMYSKTKKNLPLPTAHKHFWYCMCMSNQELWKPQGWIARTITYSDIRLAHKVHQMYEACFVQLLKVAFQHNHDP